MSTIEKLFVQIFDRKRQIIEKLEYQKQLYDQHLISKLVIQGIPPPPWLLHSDSQPSTSDLTALNKEELISGLLLPRPGPFASYPSGPCFLYDKPVITTANSGVPDETCTGKCVSSNGFDEDRPAVAPSCCVNGTEDTAGIVPPCHDDGTEDTAGVVPPCHDDGTEDMADNVPPSHDDGTKDTDNIDSLSHVDESMGTFNYAPMSPEDQIYTRYSNAHKTEQSLAKIHRSRSRQKALELRNSAKTSGKSRFGMENVSESKVHRYDEQLCLRRSLELAEPATLRTEMHSNKEVAIGNSSNMKRISDVCGMPMAQTTGSKVKEGRFGGSGMETGNCEYGGRITRSRSSSQQPAGNPSRSKTCKYNDNVDDSSGSLNLVKPFKLGTEICPKGEVATRYCSDKEKNDDASSDSFTHFTVNEVKDVEMGDNHKIDEFCNGYGGKITRSRSSSLQSVDEAHPLNVKNNEVCVGRITRSKSGLTQQAETAIQNNSKAYSGNIIRSRSIEAESEIRNQRVSVKPKQLDFDDEDCNLDIIPNHLSGTISQDTLNERTRALTFEKSCSPFASIGACPESLTNRTLEVCEINHDLSRSDKIPRQTLILPDCMAVLQSSESTEVVELSPGRTPGSLVPVTDIAPTVTRDEDEDCNFDIIPNHLSGTIISQDTLNERTRAFTFENSCSPFASIEACPETNRTLEVSEIDHDLSRSDKIPNQTLILPDCMAALQSSEATEVVELSPGRTPGSLVPVTDIAPTVTRDEAEATRASSSGYGKEISGSNLSELGAEVNICPKVTRDEAELSIGSPLIECMNVAEADQTIPEFESFVIDDSTVDAQSSGDELVHEEVPFLGTNMARTSLSEKYCESASLSTPGSPFPIGCKSLLAPGIYSSVPNGLLENIDLQSSLLMSGRALLGKSNSDIFSYPGRQYGWEVKKPFLSPVGKGFEGVTSKSGGSDKLGSSNLELTCFPIMEDPESGEEDVTDAINSCAKKIASAVKNSTNKKPLFDITNLDRVCIDSDSTDVKRTDSSTISGGNKESLCDIAVQNEKYVAGDQVVERSSLVSVNKDISTCEMQNDGKKSSMGQRKGRQTKAEKNTGVSVGAFISKKDSKPLSSRFSKPKLSGKSSLRSRGQSLSEKEQKRNNIVSNIKSFVPLVQQKQAASVLPEKRDLKVKALQAAEAARRTAEIKENERQQKKEAMKLKRARVEQEKMKEMELKRRLEEDQRRKREAENAAKKRQREEEENKEKERKKQRIEVARLQHKQAEEKLQAWKEESRCVTEEERGQQKNDFNEKTEKQLDKGFEGEEDSKKSVNDLVVVGCDRREADNGLSTLIDHKTSTGSSTTGKLDGVDMAESSTPNFDKNDKPNHQTSAQQSYDISPYQCSDDEEEELDEIANKKFVPAWASKSCVALALSSLQHIDPDVIFPGSFCSLDDVLLPRRLPQK